MSDYTPWPDGLRALADANTDPHLADEAHEARAAADHLEAAVGGWRPASEMPPFAEPEGEWTQRDSVALLVMRKGEIWIAELHDSGTDWDEEEIRWNWIAQGRDGYDLDGVTHWMPLPSKPEGL